MSNKQNGRLIKKQMTEETRSELSLEAGEAIFARLSFGTPDKASKETVSELGGYTKAALNEIAGFFTEIRSYQEELKEKIQRFGEGAKAIVRIHLARFQSWALERANLPKNQSLEMVDGRGRLIRFDDAAEAISLSCENWIFNLGKLSNIALRGKPAEGEKQGKPSMFDNAKSGKQLNGFRVSNTELVKGNASLRFNAEDSDGVIRAAILEISSAADEYNQDLIGKAGERVKRLTDLSWDNRFGLPDDLVSGLIQARIYGLLKSGAQQLLEESENKQNDYLKSIAASAALDKAEEQLRERLRSQKLYQKDHSGIGGTRFHMPEPEPMQANGLSAITWKDKAEKRLWKVAGEFGEFSPEEISAAFTVLVPTIKPLDEESFEESFSFESIQEYFTEVTSEESEELVATTTA